jgi:sigma-E factor negative regulatory protein RseC
MARNQDITHSGKIVDITPEFITVEILSESACASCHAAGLCGISEAKTKAVQVPATLDGWQIGEEVDVCLRRSMGHKAVWIAYVIPLLVVMAVLLGLLAAGVAEVSAGLAAIAAAALYYLVVYLFRDALRKEYSFYIKKK